MSRLNIKKDFNWRSILIRTALILGTVTIIVWCMPRDNRHLFKYEKGKPWRYSAFTAPFDFPIYKSDEAVEREKDSLMRDYEPYYQYDSEVERKMVMKFISDYEKGLPGLSDDYKSIVANRLHALYQQGIMNSPDYAAMHKDTARMLRIVSGKNATRIPVKAIFSAKTAYEQLFHDPLLMEHKQELQRCNLNIYIVPNLTFDKERSTASRNDLLSSIPLASGIAQRGQKIVDQGEIINENTYRILESFKKENEKRNMNDRGLQTTIMGESLYVLILIIFFTLYLSLFRKDYFDKPRSIAMLYALIIVFSVLASIVGRTSFLNVYIIPFAIVPIFVRVFMDSRTAFMAHLTMTMIVACVLRHQFDFIVIQSVSGLAAIYSLRELTQRSQIFKTAIIVTAITIAMDLASELIKTNTIEELDFGTINFIIASGVMLLFTYPLLYLIEKTFGFTSEITLIELSNTNNELLRRMSEVAPGTFQHSIQISNLAAEIANKIGAKSQLVRTGALYHDIGKMVNPIYFTENQSGVNPHENLSDIDSAQIIISHVTEGLKIAEEYNLPQEIADFISTHHGHGKAKFFYVKYKNEHPDEDVDELLFTYPGPNPFTREQAILMMADSVEAASRSLPDYTEKTIKELVNKLIDGQVQEGYFKECPITFRDITYAKTVLIEKLKTIYHTRISYPELSKN